MNQTNLISQLQDIINKLEDGNVNVEQIDIIKEFILKINFTEFSKNSSEKDLMKYLSIGWYICENINNL